MSPPPDPPRIADAAAGHPLAALLRGARQDAPRDDERAALDASLRAALTQPSPSVTPGRAWSLGVVGVAAVALWIGTRPPRTPDAPHAAPRATQQHVVAAPPPEPPRAPARATPESPATVRSETPDAPAPLAVVAEPVAQRCAPARHVLAVEEACRALRATDFAGALSTTARDRQLCPHGALREERERIAVEALARQGRHVEAARSLANFERAFPSSLHLRALRAIVDSGRPGGIPSPP